MASEPNTLVLDATAFIRLDFPQLQSLTNVSFFTTHSVVSELKDSRSRMNLDILKYSDRLRTSSPQKKLIEELKKRIQTIDPQTTLSHVDIEVLALALQLEGALVSNDLNLQNAALYLNIPIKVVSGKKITYLRKWQLKCKSCGKKIKDAVEICPICGGIVKRVSIETTKL
ncbi:MAG: NOB1 family endonuclease [Candidatus Heimdallarchaeota archaeon]|nr:MAG: NOB1 family endonuclease [Candidatus Heimdallarchaeota archaeon]